MVALDAREIHKPHRTAQHRTTGKRSLWHRLKSTLRHSARAIGHAFAALKNFGNPRMMLEALKFHIGKKMRVFIVQIDDETDIYLIIFKMIHERSTRLLKAHRPAHRMSHFPRVVMLRLHFPNLFHAKAKFWHITVRIQIVFDDHLFRQGSPHTFREKHIFTMQLHARLISVRGAAISILAKLTGDHTFDGSILMKH